MNKKECIDLVRDFSIDYLDGNIDKLVDFDFKEIRNHEKYGGSEPDNTKLANAIYVIVWSSKVNDLSIDELSSKGKYSGDIMNSFKTLFGKTIVEDDTIINFRGLEKHTNDPSTIELAKDYYYNYHRIGNMIPLINAHSNGSSLNQYKGISGWRDYFDLFLIDLESSLNGNFDTVKRKELQGFIKNNSNFFSQYTNKDVFRAIIKDFFLEPFIDENTGKAQELYTPHYYHFKKDRLSEADYIACVNNYVSKASEVITYRGNKIVEELKKHL